jgi:predicted O-methyltransferase YrrM
VFPISWKVKLKHKVNHSIPLPVVNRLLLTCPWLYGTTAINYESNLHKKALVELLSQLEMVKHVDGDVIECGSARGGTTIIMANFLRSNGIRKRIYACDSFEGFDLRELDRERKAGSTLVSDSAFTHTSYEYVQAKIKKLGVNDIVVPIKGFFTDTLPKLEPRWCFAFVDCDLKDSLVYCAETLWPSIVSNGRMLFDDYTCEYFRAARVGVDSFVERHKSEISDHGLLNDLYYVCRK